MNRPLKDRIARYLQKKGDWVASTEVERVVTQFTTYSASNGARRLRELFDEGQVERTYRIVNGKKLAYYKFVKQTSIAEVIAAGNELWESIKG